MRFLRRFLAFHWCLPIASRRFGLRRVTMAFLGRPVAISIPSSQEKRNSARSPFLRYVALLFGHEHRDVLTAFADVVHHKRTGRELGQPWLERQNTSIGMGFLVDPNGARTCVVHEALLMLFARTPAPKYSRKFKE